MIEIQSIEKELLIMNENLRDLIIFSQEINGDKNQIVSMSEIFPTCKLAR
jgi:hypothetical protein